MLAEYSADVICRLNTSLEIMYISPAVFYVLGWTPGELFGKPPEWLIANEDLPLMAAAHAVTMVDPRKSRPVTVRMKRKDGGFTSMEVSASIVRDRGTSLVKETVIVMRDVTERIAHEDLLATQARTDSLTGLANRRGFDESLEREWLRTLQDGSHMSLLLLDLDHFRSINDAYGLQFGDDCLRAVALAIQKAIRATDIACRYDGEEIAVILPAADAAGAYKAGEAVRRAIEDLSLPPSASRRGENQLTASIGVATALSRDGATLRLPEALLRAADTALHEAKLFGRNRIAAAELIAPKVLMPPL